MGRGKKKQLSKTKFMSPPLTEDEIRDIKLARKSKGKIFKTPEVLIADLKR
jgi:hypothetical protein